MIQVDNPQCSVVLFKLQPADKAANSSIHQFDLTRFLGDGGSVQTVRNLTDPGTFTISFPDQPSQQTHDTLYGLIKPMDMIEIRLARNPSLYAGFGLPKNMPINMRGFVDTIKRVEAMGDDGTPQRQIVITGQNFRKLFDINSVFFQISYAKEIPLLSLYNINAAVGMAVQFQSASSFVSDFVNKVMNNAVGKLQTFQSGIKLFEPVCTVQEGTVTPPALSNLAQGSFWDILSAFQDAPWNELFVRDVESGPQVVFRPAPFKDITGKLIMPDAEDPGSASIDIADVVSMNVSRSDAQVANFFWVPPDSSSLLTGGIVSAANLIDGDLLDFGYVNNDPVVFGYRQMEASTQLFDTSQDTVPTDAPASDQDAQSGSFVQWWQRRAKQLKNMNRDNAVFENGHLSVKGNENIAPGIYLRVRRGPIISSSYIQSVTHTFVPFQSYTTDVDVIRGDGYLKAAKYPGSQAWSEGRKGPYDATKGFTAKITTGAPEPVSAGS